jgi:hypothetical protein
VSDWSDVEAEIKRIIASSREPFDPDTIAQVADLMSFMRPRCPVPEVAKGYWSTIRFMWDNAMPGPLEIEVFGDRLEVYRFFNGRTDIQHVAHVPGAPFSAELAAELPLPFSEIPAPSREPEAS